MACTLERDSDRPELALRIGTAGWYQDAIEIFIEEEAIMYVQDTTLQPETLPEETSETLLLPETVSEVFDLPVPNASEYQADPAETIVDEIKETPEPMPQEELSASSLNNDTGEDKPFVVMLHQTEKQKNGNFIPAATIHIRPSLRTTGFLQSLAGEEVKNLMLLFTYLSPNGDITPSIYELGDALGVSPERVKDKMKKLLQARWNAHPIVSSMLRENGLDAYTPTHYVLSYVLVTSDTSSNTNPVRAAGRDQVIAHSRARYGRPRAEVERDMAIQHGWPLPEEINPSSLESHSSPLTNEQSTEHLRQRLFRVGLMKDEVDFLLSSFPQDMIEDQLEWLPYRRAKSPARYLMAAIEGNYDEPFAIRLKKQQALIGEDNSLFEES